MLWTAKLVLLSALSFLLLSCSSAQPPADLPEQQQFWQEGWEVGASLTFYMAAWGYEPEDVQDVSYAVPALEITCVQEPSGSPFYRWATIRWNRQAFDQAFLGAEIVTEFRREAGDNHTGGSQWEMGHPLAPVGELRHPEPDDFIKEARKSWLLEIRMYRQGLLSDSLLFDLRGLPDLLDHEENDICRR